MSIKIDSEWLCPECNLPLNREECGQVKQMLKNGRNQIELRCDECGEQLTADTTEDEEGYVTLNPEWVYE